MVWSWSGRCLTSSSSLPIQGAMPASGPWPCLTTRGNTDIAGGIKNAGVYLSGLMGGLGCEGHLYNQKSQ